MNKTILYILMTTILSVLAACAGPPEQQAIDPALFKYDTVITQNKHKLYFAKSGNPEGTPIIMIHGTPGGWDSYGDLMQDQSMQENYAMYSIDRLGWGQSLSANGTVEAQFKPHTDSVDALLKKIFEETQKKSIVIGHSLGGSLAPMVAIRSPHYVKGIIVIAGDIDPKFGEPRWYNSFADLWLIKKILPNALVKANDEIMPLKQELVIMNKRLNEINVPVTIIHGTKDNLVSYDNVAYVKNALQHLNEDLHIISIKDAGHFLIWEHIPTIVESIINIDK